MNPEQRPSDQARPAEIASGLSLFLGRRLQGIWRSHNAKAGVTDLWLAFVERLDAPNALRLTATPVTVLPGWVEGGGQHRRAKEPDVPDQWPSLTDTLCVAALPPSIDVERICRAPTYILCIYPLLCGAFQPLRKQWLNCTLAENLSASS